MIKTNIKMRVTPEQSRRVQEICFENGILWEFGRNIVQELNAKFLYIKQYIKSGDWTDYFERHQCEEVDSNLFIKTNGTCEEAYLTKYTSQPKDLESALKKIENLHIALNKKVEKNKNQALEITKLLEQKKDLQDKLNQANRVIKVGIDNSADLVNFLDKKDDIIKNLENDLEDYRKCKEIIKKYNFIDERNKCVSKILQGKYDYIDFSISNSNNITDKINNQWNRIKELEQQLNKIGSESEKQLKEKDTIISYLESKLK